MKIEFVIPTYRRLDKLRLMLQSLIVQDSPDWFAHVIHDGYDVNFLNFMQEYSKYENITYSAHGKRNHNDWGHSVREYGKDDAREEILVMTSDDNYYTPNFVREVLEEFKNPLIYFVYCDMINNLLGYAATSCAIEPCKIDIGCFATRTKFAKRIELGKDYASDYHFAKDYVDMFCLESNIKKINKILYVHN